MKKALIFDCDGVLGDTEQFGHLVAFNQMWKELVCRGNGLWKNTGAS